MKQVAKLLTEIRDHILTHRLVTGGTCWGVGHVTLHVCPGYHRCVHIRTQWVYGTAVALPEFISETGYLPPGRHRCTWTSFVERFAWNTHRVHLAKDLFQALTMLRRAGCRTCWVNGSYTTEKEWPRDVDVLWDAWGVVPRDLDPLFRSERPAARAERRKRYGGDFFAVFDDQPDGALIRHFQTDRSDVPKGIVEISLSSLTTRSHCNDH